MEELDELFGVLKFSNTEEKGVENSETEEIQEITLVLDKEHNNMIEIIKQCYDIYFLHGARSSKKTDCLHNFIKSIIDSVIIEKKLSYYSCKTEYNVPSINASGRKKCDIVLLKNLIPVAVFPVKLIMTNYFQNKNNYWEQLTGELTHLKFQNPELKIFPINIIPTKIPYLTSKKMIAKIEIVSYENSFKIYEFLEKNKIVSKNFNFLIDVIHKSESINELYNKSPDIIGFASSTPFISIKNEMSNVII